MWAIEEIEQLKELYCLALKSPKEWTYQRIGDELGRSHDSIRARLYDLGLKGLKEAKNKFVIRKEPKESICEYCKKLFIITTISVQKFCSKECRINNSKNKYKYICLNCGNKFGSAYKSHSMSKKPIKFCSQKCYFEYRKKETRRKNSKICEICGKEFFSYTKSQKFCSKKCKNKSQKNEIISTCLNCGIEFKTIASKLEKGRKFCSRDCYSKYKQAAMDKICPMCNKKFKAKIMGSKNKGNKHRQIYCSSNCLSLSKRKRVIMTCLNCGKNFYCKISEKNKRKYCSEKCKSIHKNKRYIELNNIKKFLIEKYYNIYVEMTNEGIIFLLDRNP